MAVAKPQQLLALAELHPREVVCEELLEEAVAEAQRLGSASVEATAWGAFAYLRNRQDRPASALAASQRAAAIAANAGDIHAQLRWEVNGAVEAVEIGDLATAADNLARVTAICRQRRVEPPFWLRAVEADLVKLGSGDLVGAIALLEELVEDPWWPGFGRIASEADLARIRGG